MPKTYDFTHGRVPVEYAEISGYCYFPDRLDPGPEELGIVIDSRLRGVHLLDALIHEAMHLEHPTMSEEDVARTATVIAKMLRGEGWRNKEEVK